MADPLEGCRAKLGRAAFHLDSLKPEYEEWFAGGLGIVETEQHDVPGDPGSLWRVVECSRLLRRPPPHWGLVVGDAIQNIRAALDHLVCRLVECAGGVPDRSTSFPILDSAPEGTKQRRNFERSLRGLSNAHMEAICRLQPYNEPNSDQAVALGRLRALSNADKHRVLLPTLLVLGSPIPLVSYSLTPLPDQIEQRFNTGAELAPGVEIGRARTLSGRPDMRVHIGYELEIGYRGGAHVVTGKAVREIRDLVVGIIESFRSAFARQRVELRLAGSVQAITHAMNALQELGELRLQDPVGLSTSGNGDIQVLVEGAAGPVTAKAAVEEAVVHLTAPSGQGGGITVTWS